jgi:hypothetical protein
MAKTSRTQIASRQQDACHSSFSSRNTHQSHSSLHHKRSRGRSSCRAEPHANSMTYGALLGEKSGALFRYRASDGHTLPDSYSCDNIILSPGRDAWTQTSSFPSLSLRLYFVDPRHSSTGPWPRARLPRSRVLIFLRLTLSGIYDTPFLTCSSRALRKTSPQNSTTFLVRGDLPP